ncbi:MAG: hypothetical protein HDS13_00185 [Bacteroides sp.]|nr:hypothetical protein [Bacteroides sp.]
MSDTMTLNDMLKALALAASALGLSTLCVSSSGELVRLREAIRIDMTPQTLVLDDISETSILCPDVSTQNVPGGAGTGAMVMTLVTSYGTRFQFLAKAGSGGVLFFRAYSKLSAAWHPFQKVTMTPV